jgi:hypothetical protein
MVGGSIFIWEFARCSISEQSESTLLRQRCDAPGFEPLPIEIIAKQKVALAFEAQKGARAWRPPAAPDEAWWGAFRSPEICWASFSLACCDGVAMRAGFERLTIEIIAKRRVARAFEAQKGCETGAPGNTCKVLFCGPGIQWSKSNNHCPSGCLKWWEASLTASPREGPKPAP